VARIALLTGGSTPERDVAFAGAAQVVATLRELGHGVTVVDTVEGPLAAEAERRILQPEVERQPPTRDELEALAARERLPELVGVPAMRSADLVFLVLHGRQGEGGSVQSLLELAGLAYTGSDALGSALAMDKDVSKRLFVVGGLPTARWERWPADEAALAELGPPWIVKPSNAGSTVGVTVVRDPSDLALAVETAQAVDREVLLEEFLPGREFSVGVLGDRALAVGEIIPAHEIFDYECKYTPGMSREIFPADVPPALARRMQEQALATHRVLRLRDFSRVDFKLGRAGDPFVLEANTLPGMTRTSLLPQSAAAVGIDFAHLCQRIVELALNRS
jgi:D-alanine-D-alanine ligase